MISFKRSGGMGTLSTVIGLSKRPNCSHPEDEFFFLGSMKFGPALRVGDSGSFLDIIIVQMEIKFPKISRDLNFGCTHQFFELQIGFRGMTEVGCISCYQE